jgi:Uma2 family endonuclease
LVSNYFFIPQNPSKILSFVHAKHNGFHLKQLIFMTLVAEKKMTIAEFLERDDFEEGYIYELINGEIMKRTSPNLVHQDASMMLSTHLNLYIMEHKLGRLYAAPTDVYMSKTVDLVVPDLSFIPTSNAAYFQPSGYILGVPDLIVEILSKGTYQLDRGDKMRLYRRFGVQEYWIVDPVKKSIEVHVLENNEYILKSYAEEFGEIESWVLTDLKLEVAKIFV